MARSPYLFTKPDLRSALDFLRTKLKEEVQSLDPDYLLNASETDLCAAFVAESAVHYPTLKPDEIYIHDQCEVEVDVSQDPNRGIIDRSEPFYIKGTQITVAIPFEGEGELFQYQPSSFTTVLPRGNTLDQEVRLTYTMATFGASRMPL